MKTKDHMKLKTKTIALLGLISVGLLTCYLWEVKKQ
jgi:hypothetical protein